MLSSGSEERIGSANSSPRLPNKSTTTTLFGLLTKRSTKIEPHPLNEQNAQEQQHHISFAKCSPDKKQLHIASNESNNVKLKCQTLPAATGNVSQDAMANNGNEKSQSSGFLNLHRKVKSASRSKASAVVGLDGSLSDGGDEVTLRKTARRRSPNHNRFSHQFSLCCKAEKKPMTPPVTVRYNSIPDGNNVQRRDNLSLSLSITDNASQSLQLFAPNANVLQECSSAPESPVTEKLSFPRETFGKTHRSPSNASTKSAYFNDTSEHSVYPQPIGSTSTGPIRPIAVSDCKSRLRLKLYPPGTELYTPVESLKRATTPQHMSSPNIATQVDHFAQAAPLSDMQFNSYENIKRHGHYQENLRSGLSGLSEQAMMSVQMLNVISTEQARERSLLDGRLGCCSLLGPTELSRVLPAKEVYIFVGTWNMNGQNPPKQMNDFVLPATVENMPDIVAVGTQESSPDRFEWEATLQETLGPSHVLFHSTTLGTLHLAIYMRRDLIWYCSAPEDASMSVRTGSAFRTKGAVAISFCLFGTSMLFVTSHLTAHQQKVKERVSDVKRIIHALDLPKNLNLRHKNKDVTQNFDNVFWCGDLNFRLSEPREKLLEWIQNTKFPLPSHLPHGYMHTDQLTSVLSDGAAFRGFMEANITFPPTYKYDAGTQHFDTSSKQRAPAYTDRILYKYRQIQGLGPVMRRQSTVPGVSTPTQPYVQCLLYDSVPSIITSDHKPVWALFRTFIRAGTDAIPLAAGLFNRDVYLEGMKRRLNNKYSGSSAVCAIQ